jgi:predicted ribosomally synthesized peptide with nif11-like leader
MANPIESFIGQLFKDSALQAEIGAAGTRENMISTTVKIAQRLGFSFSAAEISTQLARLQSPAASGELSDAMLGAVAGGRAPNKQTFLGPSYGSSTLCTFCSDANGGKTFNQ